MSGPELKLGVRKFGLQLQRAGSRIDLVVDALERTGIDDRHAVIAKHVHSQHTRGGGGVDPHDLLLRQAELHRDRLQLGDDHQPGHIGGMDDVALIDLTQAGAARQRRDDLGVAQHCLGIVDRRLIGIHQRLLLRDHSALRVVLLL